MDGDYIEDMVKQFEGVGISDVHAVNSKEWSGGTLPDALVGVLALNEEVDVSDKLTTMREKFENQGDGKGQLNLVGYSYGSLVAAHVAMTRVKKGGTVDNLVLIGSPISKEFLNTLRKTEGIRNVIVKNLTQHGDPIYAGMSGAEVVMSSFTLARQMPSGEGHFYYAPNTAIGTERRKDLGWELYDAGLR